MPRRGIARYDTGPMTSPLASPPNSALLDWSAIDTVLLDMDGTILDLRFDNRFWLETVPARYASLNEVTLDVARARLRAAYEARIGTLDWYSVDYWTTELAMDIEALKREEREHIGWLPGAEQFVLRMRAIGKRVVLVTNAHPTTLALKDEQLDFRGHFDAMHSSHEFGVPKENPAFWPALAAVERFDVERTLFVDDSLPVLRAARGFGIRWIVAIAHPDSTQPKRVVEEFAAVDAIRELTPA